MDNYTLFLAWVGIASISWNLCKLVFWLDNPNKNTRGK